MEERARNVKESTKSFKKARNVKESTKSFKKADVDWTFHDKKTRYATISLKEEVEIINCSRMYICTPVELNIM
ncbi:Hypothetical predicted protein [Octopus vulgaris]|uniref:Uncharacterized protein n=1 Tax=Octopus vulgaris TaxID=6645 RepID=A0AA36BZ60_OCTVU|nr:Hypothetical predicted protein [Octopus vulgaris]